MGAVALETGARSRDGPVAGLFGKLPAHGDFVRRGWPDDTVDAVDRWLTETMDSVRMTRDDAAFDAWMRSAPLWRGYVPPGALGCNALHLGVAPSIDRAGRLFPLAVGMAGSAAEAWAHAAGAGRVVDAAIYDALAGRADADATVATVAGSSLAGDGGTAPMRSAWWLTTDGEPLVESEAVDAALLERLLGEGQG